jgi:hypothetical protein
MHYHSNKVNFPFYRTKEGQMAAIRNWTVITCLLGIAFLFSNCATQEEATRPPKLLEGPNLEFAGNRIELRNPMPRNGEEVEVVVIVRNRGNQDAKRIPVFFYDNLRVFSTDEINLESGGQQRLSARWRATTGNHSISVVLDPAHHFKEMGREKSEVSITVLVK